MGRLDEAVLIHSITCNACFGSFMKSKETQLEWEIEITRVAEGETKCPNQTN